MGIGWKLTFEDFFRHYVKVVWFIPLSLHYFSWFNLFSKRIQILTNKEGQRNKKFLSVPETGGCFVSTWGNQKGYRIEQGIPPKIANSKDSPKSLIKIWRYTQNIHIAHTYLFLHLHTTCTHTHTHRFPQAYTNSTDHIHIYTLHSTHPHTQT